MQDERKEELEGTEEVEAHRFQRGAEGTEEVEAHGFRAGAEGSEDPGRSDEQGSDEDDVEAHRWPIKGPEEFGKRF